jgi:hypothetical protein
MKNVSRSGAAAQRRAEQSHHLSKLGEVASEAAGEVPEAADFPAMYLPVTYLTTIREDALTRRFARAAHGRANAAERRDAREGPASP